MPDDKRVNVLVYAGDGATLDSVKHATWSLRRLLGPNYAVHTITGDQILKEPWTGTCALLVMPGGADLAYGRKLNGEGNRRIRRFVELGGAYLGFCAGGYYGSGHCEFEIGKPEMEVVGDRELAFFPGTCRGLAFPGFVYHSEAGARATPIRINKSALTSKHGELAEECTVYYNGGGAFVDADEHTNQGVEILASYTEPLAVDTGIDSAAVVYCKVGSGAAVLCGPHPEFSWSNLNARESTNPKYGDIIEALKSSDQSRSDFVKACLVKLGLQVSDQVQDVPSLSPLHLSAIDHIQITKLLQKLREHEIIAKDTVQEYIKGENDTFRIEPSATAQQPKGITQSVTDVISSALSSVGLGEDRSDSKEQSLDTGWRLFTHEDRLPESKTTPHFSHHVYFDELQAYRKQFRSEVSSHNFGSPFLYGEVVTSTSTLLEKNPSLLAALPDGFTAAATTQVAGRGRGSNVWVSPPGSLMFSTVLRHSLKLTSAPVVFVQYLAAMAMVLGVQNYDPSIRGYRNLDIRLKWPNDVYAFKPSPTNSSVPASERSPTDYAKISGILVNSSYSGSGGVGAAYSLVVGIGVNVNNLGPTTSLADLAAAAGLPPFRLEKLLASILVQFENLYARFCRTGFDSWLERLYYSQWMHTDQVVTLETEGGAVARIKGISTDFGLLIAEELRDGRFETGRRFQLQSDSNSFDFLKGLIKRKL